MSALPFFKMPINDAGEIIPAYRIIGARKSFIAWKVGMKKPDGRFAKMPVACILGGDPNDDLSHEHWSDERHHVTMAEAVAFAEKHGLAGIGIVPQRRDGLVVGDLDHARDEGGALREWAKRIVAGPSGHAAVYCEWSPSKTGVRFLALGAGSVPASMNDVELFDGTTKKFITLTGWRWPKAPSELVDAEAVVDRALARAGVKIAGANQGEVVPASTPGASKPAGKVVGPLADVTAAIAKSALETVPAAGLSYVEWIKVGQALHHQFGGSAEGFGLFDDWCMGDGARYKEDEPQEKWETFGAKEGRGSVTMKFVLKLAVDKGWKPPPRASSDAFNGSADAGGQDQWEAPLSLDGMKAEAPAGQWVPGTLPSMLERFAHGLADMLGGTAEAVLGMMLPILGAMTPGAVGFAPRGAGNPWRVPVLFYAALVGAPGSLKTPILSALTDPITSKEKQWRRDHKKAEAKWMREVERRKAETPKGEKPDPLPRPVQRRRSTTNATVEGHAKLIERTGEAIITLAEELALFLGGFDKYTGTSATGGTDRPYWLSGYEGKPYHSDRADTAKSVSVESVKASVIGGIQPGVLASVLGALTSDGLAARFLFVPTGDRRMSKDIAADHGRAAVYALAGRLVLELADGEMGVDIGLVGDDDAKEVSREAEALGLEWMAALPEVDPLRDIAAKAHGFVARITAALHVIEWATGEAADMVLGQKDEPDPLPLTVKGVTARKALAIWRAFYWPNARRTYVAALSNALDKDVVELAAFVKDRDPKKESFTATDAGAAVRRFRGKGNEALAAAAIRLEKARWLRRQDIGGGTRWIINPAVRAA